MRILITGARGQLGNEFQVLAHEFPQYEYQFIDIEDVDLSNIEHATRFFKDKHPQIIINCAAYTAVDLAEAEPDKASALNAELPELLASVAKRDQSMLIHYSTDYVFDGKDYKPYTETHPPDPQSIYGKSKLDGENAILMNSQHSVIIRTSWLYSSFGRNFVKTILEKGKQTGNLRVVYDQIGCPTYARDLAYATLSLIPKFLSLPQNEIFHYSGEGVTSWFDFAVTVLKLSGITCQVDAVETKDYPTPAVRPYYSVFNKSKIKALGITIPYWHDSLEKCLLQILQNKS
ncbi:MAG: dTDP-4-dehydrorhamnose reductase [Bacteroidales bacterium]